LSTGPKAVQNRVNKHKKECLDSKGPAALHNKTNKLPVMEQFSLQQAFKYQRKKLSKIFEVIYRTHRKFLTLKNYPVH
jgi:hypothetical protein